MAGGSAMKFSLQTVCAWVLAGVFGWAGALKALDPAAFAESISGFRLVPWALGVAVAHYVPWLEMIVAVAVVTKRWRRAGLVIAGLLLSVFMVIWAITWARGLDVACGCFGGSGSTSAAWALLRVSLLAGLAWCILVWDEK
jgi:putative oxidoreductase